LENLISCAIIEWGENKQRAVGDDVECSRWRVEALYEKLWPLYLCFYEFMFHMLSSAFCVNWLSTIIIITYNIEPTPHGNERKNENPLFISLTTEMMMIRKDLFAVFVIMVRVWMKIPKKVIICLTIDQSLAIAYEWTRVFSFFEDYQRWILFGNFQILMNLLNLLQKKELPNINRIIISKVYKLSSQCSHFQLSKFTLKVKERKTAKH
jgi:hypothetical protein